MNWRIKYPAFVAVAGGVLFLISGLYVSRGGQVPSYAILFGLPSLLLVIGSASIELQSYLAIPKSLIFLGNASYSIYLTHAMFVNIFSLIFQRVNWIAQANPPIVMIAMVIGSVLGGSAVYLFLERPLLSLMRTKILPRGKASVVPISSPE